MLALARKIVSGEEDTGTVESVFAEAQLVAADAEALLVDEGWHAAGQRRIANELSAMRRITSWIISRCRTTFGECGSVIRIPKGDSIVSPRAARASSGSQPPDGPSCALRRP